MALSKEQKKDYILKGGIRCPFCNSSDITAGVFEGEAQGQYVSCFNCHREWRDVYKLVDVEEIKEEGGESCQQQQA
jgi:formate dehydrogenase maturation protein FdhE